MGIRHRIKHRIMRSNFVIKQGVCRKLRKGSGQHSRGGGQQSEPVQVPDMDFGITYVHGIIKLPAQGIDKGENPCPCREVHTTAKADRKIT